MSTADDPLERYDALVMEGRAPDPAAFAAEYPNEPDLLRRITALDHLRGALDHAVAPPPPSRNEWPQSVGGYRIEARLGEGGMGRVFRGVTPEGQPCAIKVMRWSTAQSRTRFEREAELAQRLEHPGIARVLAFGADDELAYLVTELVLGPTLRELLDRAPGIASKAELGGRVRIALQVAEALGHAHRLGVVHRDIKPSNIIVTPHVGPRLIDFGLALDPEDHDHRITRTGVFVGSHAYAAPEQLRGEKTLLGPWTDVFALGVCAFEMVTGKLPFRGLNAAARLLPKADRPVAAPRDLNRAVSRRLNGIILRAIDRRIKKRFVDGQAMAEALGRVK